MSGWAKRTPDAPALSTGSGVLSYVQLEDRIARCASYLAAHGVTAHRVCALDLRDRQMFVICWFALFRLRVTSLSFAPDMPVPRRNVIRDQAGVGIVVGDGPEWSDGTDHVPVTMERVMAERPNDAVDTGPVQGDSPHAMLVVGSGTTGPSKLIAIGFDAILGSAPQEAVVLGFRATDTVMSTVRPWVSSAILKAVDTFAAGGCFHLATDPKLNLFDTMRTAGVTHLVAAVVHVEQMLKLVERVGHGVPGDVRLTIYGSLVTDGLVKRAQARLTPFVRILYAANEVGPLAVVDVSEHRRVSGSVGPVCACSQVEIVDTSGHPVGHGQDGVVRARGPRMFSGYVGSPEETAHSLRDGWFYPGDAARFGADGQLIMLGRADHLMVYDGINIHPAEIEDVISTHPDVQDVAVMPIRHKIHQDVPVCAVVLKNGARVRERDLKRFAHGFLAERLPARIIGVAQIPRTEGGKLKRDVLHAQLIERMRSQRR